MNMVAVQFGVVILAAMAGYSAFGRLRLPRSLGGVLAGVVVGPSLLGSVPVYGFPLGLFPALPTGAVSPELFAFGTVASVIFLFVHGLETDVSMLRRHCSHGCLLAAFGITASFILGDLIGMKLMQFMGTASDFMSPECLFFGLVGTATSAGIAVRTFSLKRKLDSPEAATFFSCAASDRVLSIVLLAIVLGSIGSLSPSHGLRPYTPQVLCGSPVVVASWLLLLLAALWISGRIANSLKASTDRSNVALVLLGLALAVAGLSERAGVAAVLGAYVAGVALSKSNIGIVLRAKSASIYGILVPALFCMIGMMIDARSFAGPGVFACGLIFAATVIVTRLVATGLLAMPLGFTVIGAARIGAGMIPRGEVALLILGIGIVDGILPAQMAAALLVMIAATAFAGIASSSLAIGSSASGTHRPTGRAAERKLEFAFPSPETAEMAANRLLSVFEAEGFSSHRLDLDTGAYLVRKDDMAIGVQRAGRNILLDCSETEAPLANAGICEAIADLEKVISDLRQTVNEKALFCQLQDLATIGPWKLSLADYLDVSAIKVNLSARTKQEAIAELLDILAAHTPVRDIAEAKRAIWNREEIMSTGMQHGIAIPHGKTDGVDKLVCAMGLKREGVDFASLDGELTKIIILVLSPDNAVAPYMQLVATIGHVLDEKMRTLLLACRTPAEVRAVLGGASLQEPVVKPQAADPQPVPATAHPNTAQNAFSLTEFVRPEQVNMELAATTKAEVIDELLHLLEENGHIKDFKEARKAVLDREAKMTTGTQDGVAIPHAITPAVSTMVCAIGIKRAGLEFGSIDGKPSTLFIMALAPREELHRYIQFLGAIGRIVSDPTRQSIMKLQTRQEVCDIFANRQAASTTNVA